MHFQHLGQPAVLALHFLVLVKNGGELTKNEGRLVLFVDTQIVDAFFFIMQFAESALD